MSNKALSIIFYKSGHAPEPLLSIFTDGRVLISGHELKPVEINNLIETLLKVRRH
jgi:hypothetical protein